MINFAFTLGQVVRVKYATGDDDIDMLLNKDLTIERRRVIPVDQERVNTYLVTDGVTTASVLEIEIEPVLEVTQ